MNPIEEQRLEAAYSFSFGYLDQTDAFPFRTSKQGIEQSSGTQKAFCTLNTRLAGSGEYFELQTHFTVESQQQLMHTPPCRDAAGHEWSGEPL